MMTASMSLRARIFVVIASGEDVAAPHLFAARKPAVVAIGHGHELHAGDLHGGRVSPMPWPPAPISAIWMWSLGETGAAGCSCDAASA